METQFKIELRKEREFGDKVNGTFTFLSQNFAALFRIFIYIPLPFAIAGGIAMGMFQSNFFDVMRQNIQVLPSSNPAFTAFDRILNLFSPVYFIAVFCLALATLFVHATTFAYMKLYLSEEKQNITFEKVWSILSGKILPLIIYCFMLMVLIILASVFFIIPGIYLSIVFSIFLPVFIIEDRTMGECMSRCFYLIKDNWWSTSGLLIVVYIIVALANFIFQVPQLAFTLLSTLGLFKEQFPALSIFVNVIATTGSFMLQSIVATALGLQYFNLVELKDGIGLRGLIELIGNNATLSERNVGEF